jgi:ABC-type sugar transport system ATPase subunit
VADRVAILHLGHMVASGPIAEFDAPSVVEYMTFGKTTRSPEPNAGQV